MNCVCKDIREKQILSARSLDDTIEMFNQGCKDGFLIPCPVDEPYHIGYVDDDDKKIISYATKWYRCKSCGCLFEVLYPDFPMPGFVRRFDDGIYHKQEFDFDEIERIERMILSYLTEKDCFTDDELKALAIEVLKKNKLLYIDNFNGPTIQQVVKDTLKEKRGLS